MKKWMVMLLAVVGAGCGNDEKDTCQKYEDLGMEVVKEACKGQSDCAYCDCVTNEKKNWTGWADEDGGKCVDLTKEQLKAIEKCEKDDFEYAKDCLDDKEACKKDWLETQERVVAQLCP